MPSNRFPAPAPRRGKGAASRADSAPSGQPKDEKLLAKRADRQYLPNRRKTRRSTDDFTATPPADILPENVDAESNRDNPARDAETESFLQPGIKPVTELLRQTPAKIDAVFVRKGRKGRETDLILNLCREAGVRFSLVDDAFLGRLWHGQHQGVIARLFSTGFTDLPDLLTHAPDAPLPLIVALDQVQDPGNAGALARTLYALGGAGLIVPRHNGVYLGAAAARIAAGALDKLAVAKAGNLAQALDAALDAGYTVYGADSALSFAENASEIPVENVFAFSPRLPAVLVLGSEEGGLRPVIRKRCTSLIAIPFAREFDSLNVAQAGAVIISAFAAARQKDEETA